MYAFDYKRPASLDEAKSLRAADEEAMFVAGGQTLVPTLKQRLASPTALIDLARLDELKGIERQGEAVAIGAGEVHAAVAASALVREAIPALAYLAGEIGDPAVRHRGTLGGSVANADPTADYPAALLALGATVHTSERTIAAEDFFVDLFETALDEGEIVTKVSFPIPKRCGYAKFPNPASRYAIVGAFVAETADGIKVAVTGAGPKVFRVPEIEAALSASFTPDAAKAVSVSADDLSSDMHASADYRAHLISVMASRAVASAG